MREIVTAVEMKELDHNTIQKAGISSPVLMERAALKTVEEIVQRLKNKEKEKILVVCGTGNNGGDAEVAEDVGHHVEQYRGRGALRADLGLEDHDAVGLAAHQASWRGVVEGKA